MTPWCRRILALFGHSAGIICHRIKACCTVAVELWRRHRFRKEGSAMLLHFTACVCTRRPRITLWLDEVRVLCKMR